MTDRKDAKAFDDAMNGKRPENGNADLVATAERVKAALAVPVPPADRERALFLSGVAARERARFSPARMLVPALALAVIAYAVIAGQAARPGERLYPVREALNAVGIGEDATQEVEDRLFAATGLVHQADEVVDQNPARAIALAVQAIEHLGTVRDLIPELEARRRAPTERAVVALEDKAVAIIAEASPVEEDDENAGSEDEDRSGSNSGSDGDSGSDDDSSGPGSGDDSEADDNSGSGSDDSGFDDNSGSGSDDSDSDDNSGSGSDSDDSSGSGGGDNSGSGSDDRSDDELDIDSSGSGSGGSSGSSDDDRDVEIDDD